MSVRFLQLAVLVALVFGCDAEIGNQYTRRPGGGDPSRPGLRLPDGGQAPGESPGGGASPGPGVGPGAGRGPDGEPPPTGVAVNIPVDADRPATLMPRDQLAKVAGRAPKVSDAWLKGILESTDTLWYDSRSMAPGYQDSAGDNSTFVIGMRPNTIRPSLIVAGGHELVFEAVGRFHFPFGRPAGSTEQDLYVADFWHVPRGDDGKLLPVVHWPYKPNGFTSRVEWMFPNGTVFGELMFIQSGGELFPFEIRIRIREGTRWRVDVLRPFPTAAEFATALEAKRRERSEWQSSRDVDTLIEHARNPGTLAAASLSARNFASAFPRIQLAEDVLPTVTDDSILRELLRDTAFRSARGARWKDNGSLHTYAPTSRGGFGIVPRGYNGGFLDVNEETCNTCHRDAGRPLKDWYTLVTLYGEVWGADDNFTWHPFEEANFVDSQGAVVSFNHDNRRMRRAFVDAGLVAQYSEAAHPSPNYTRIAHSWSRYSY